MSRTLASSRWIARVPVALALFVAVVSFAPVARAKAPSIQRHGGQWGITLGGSACIPGKAECQRDDVLDGGITIDGETRPSFGLNAELGYRINPFVFVGASYHLGFFDTDYDFSSGTDYSHAYQQSVFGVVRPTLPLWRFDFGFGVGAGFSRQTFRVDGPDRDYTQGFSFMLAPSIDLFVSRRVFIGVRADLLFNAHRRFCNQRSSNTVCTDSSENDLAPVHQTIFGLHIGGTFL